MRIFFRAPRKCRFTFARYEINEMQRRHMRLRYLQQQSLKGHASAGCIGARVLLGRRNQPAEIQAKWAFEGEPMPSFS